MFTNATHIIRATTRVISPLPLAVKGNLYGIRSVFLPLNLSRDELPSLDNFGYIPIFKIALPPFKNFG
jgi:hypothetical protein